MDDHGAYLHQLDVESANVQRLAAAAAAQRRNEEQTYYLNQKPYTHCEGGKLYDIYLLHKGRGQCPSRLNTVNIGYFNSPQEALKRAQSMSQNVMFCPECLPNLVSEKFKKSYSQSFYSKEPTFHQFVLGKAAIVGGDSKQVKRMFHHKGCAHYQLKGGVDFGYQTSTNAFLDAVEEAYSDLTIGDLQPCAECFPDMFSGLKEKNKTLVFRHMLRENLPGGRIMLHHYGCPDCLDGASDLGWTFMTYVLACQLYPDFASKKMRGLLHCDKCMSEAEYKEILNELIGKIRARYGAIVNEITKGALNKAQLIAKSEEISEIGEIIQQIESNSW